MLKVKNRLSASIVFMKAIEKVISFLAPHHCLKCGQEGSLLCNYCSYDVCLPVPERCYRCQKLSLGSRTCDRCRRTSKLSHVWVVTEYEGPLKELVHKLKFERAKAAAKLIAEYLDASLPYLKPETIVCNVPTSTVRRRVRGYDQVELIAKEFAARRGLLYAKLLTRAGQQRQVGASRQVRLRQLENAFTPVNLSFIKKAQILLIDDVLTTGATLETTAKVLKQASAKTVNGAVFAQSL